MSYQIDVSRGSLNSTVSQQWAMRPDDQRFTSLTALREQVAKWADESHVREVMPSELRAVYDANNPHFLGLALGDDTIEASHWSFDQVASLARAPSNYLRSLPGPLAATNLNWGLKTAEAREQALYLREPEEGGLMLRGLTSTKYGRILDKDVVDAVMKVAGNGTGDTRWKVPGTIEWGGAHGITYNPKVDITKQNTTLYASDRDVFLFLVDDLNPIEVGKLANGAPDLMFRGFYVWNSEVGCRTFGIATMYLRGVCQNRNLWGVEGFNEVTFKHTAGAPERFVEHAAPALAAYAEGSTVKLVEGVKAAKQAIVASDDEERLEFLAKFGIGSRAGKQVLDTVVEEEGAPAASVWDFAQGITAYARREDRQEDRLKLEGIAGKMLDKVAA